MPDQMILQIHESIGHPLELDRILGDERNYAGTSFIKTEDFGRYQYGSSLLNVSFDPEIPEELASYRQDDDGSPARKEYLIREGRLLRPLGGALSQHRSGLEGVASSRASSWNRAPIDRMANLNLEPGDKSFAQLVAGIERGVLMSYNRSWSIDDARNKFQFGCEWGQLIEDGELKGVVKNPNYRGISAQFWRNLSAVGDAGTFEVLGTPYCGKGEPNQVIRVGHASPACVFSDVDVFGRYLMHQEQHFEALAEDLRRHLAEGEDFTLWYSAEDSEFIRFNRARVRQTGQVRQASALLRLIRDERQASLDLTLSGAPEEDRQRLAEGLRQLRQSLAWIPADPYLLLDTSAWQRENQDLGAAPDSGALLASLERRARDLDLVGIYAAGPLFRGFANSWGAFGWHAGSSFNFDWSLFHGNGQAVKADYAGQRWDDEAFARRFEQAGNARPPGQAAAPVAPGDYRAYLAPAASRKSQMLCWGGFSARALATGESPCNACRTATPCSARC